MEVLAVLTATIDAPLAMLSILVAVIGSFVAIDLAEQTLFAQKSARVCWTVGSGLTLGLCIWAMHFIAMLAYRLPIQVGYNFLLVLASLLVAIAGSTLGMMAILRQLEATWTAWIGGGLLIGSGIVGMHYTAMAAMQLAAAPNYTPGWVLTSGGVAIVSAILSLGLTAYPPIRLYLPDYVRLIGGGLLMGTAICGMHYLAMFAVSYEAIARTQQTLSLIDNATLAVAISLSVIAILMLTLLAGYFGRRLSAELAQIETLRQSEDRLEQLVQQRTKELEAEKAIAESANQVKTNFLSNTSHELRSPLTSIIGFSSVLLKQVFGELNPKQQQYINEIHKSGYQLLDLINDLLDLSKIEAGQTELSLETVSVAELCQDCLLQLQTQASDRGLELSSTIAPTVTTCTADKRRLQQILLNLLFNAVKFTESGSVRLAVEQDSNCILFSVIDTGIGIAKSNLSRLFQPFVQLDAGLDRKYQGTGLGLALARDLARLHGGDITVQSELGQGSCFTLTLPIKAERTE